MVRVTPAASLPAVHEEHTKQTACGIWRPDARRAGLRGRIASVLIEPRVNPAAQLIDRGYCVGGGARVLCQLRPHGTIVLQQRQRPCNICFGVGGGLGSESAGDGRDTAHHRVAAGDIPPSAPQSPTATTHFGFGVARHVRSSASRMFLVTGPVTSNTSAWRGEATKRRP